MTALDLDAISASTDSAVRPPWRVEDGWLHPFSIRVGLGAMRHEDAEFIAQARENVPALVARVRELEALLQDLRSNHEPDDGEWLCPEDAEEVCDVCLNGGAHEGKVCYTCSDPESNMAIWPCHVARAIDAALGGDPT